LIAPALEIRVVLRNDGVVAAKPRFALVVEKASIERAWAADQMLKLARSITEEEPNG